MNTDYYRSYEQERTRKAEERSNAPKHCPYCGIAINEHLNEWDRIKTSCGSDKCRKAASRASLAERKRQARTDARQRVLSYCEAQLDQEQKGAVMEACDALMEYSYDEGHQIAEHIISVIEAKRCKHDRITELECNAAVWQRRAQASERQLKERIQELEAELEMFNNLSNTIHGIAMKQLERQPDPVLQELQPTMTQKPEANDADRAQVLSVLAQAGIKLYEGGDEEDDDTEQGDSDEDEESHQWWPRK